MPSAPTALAQTATPRASAPALDSITLAGFKWRNIGPANMGGRVTSIAGIPSPSRTFYVATAASGIWKTTNAGTSFQPVFEHEPVSSMGELAIAPSDTNVIYAGTGEEDSRNSISPGGGMYKSTNGGRTWTFIGLGETQQIGRIVVAPNDPNTVYVAALGHAWGPNKERGLYKTTDGGATWKLSKFISDKAGFVDVAMDPSDPNTLYASSWERVRGPYFLKSGGPGSGLWKTTDAGATWTEIKGGGFPATMKGRIGLAIAHSNPKIVYAVIEADSLPNPVRNKSTKGRQKLGNGLYRSIDAGTTWTKMNDHNERPFYYSEVRVDPSNPDRVYWSSTPVNFSDDAGKTVRNATVGIHVDHHAMWIDPNDPAHFVVGDDGGVSQTWDRGGNYDFINTFAIGQFYDVSYDMGVPYRVCGGLQDNGSWCGPSRRKQGNITNAMWFVVGGGDGFYTAQDQTNSDIIFAESQGGGIGRLNYATGERTQIRKPSYRERFQSFEDSIVVARGDTTQPEAPTVKRTLAELRARQKNDSIASDMRFKWEAPYFLSAHSPQTLYMGGNRVLKSLDLGDHLFPISPDLSTNDTAKINVSLHTTGGITLDATGAETYGTITTLAESPIRAGLLFAGTDDGNVWLTRNDGTTWENLTGRFPGVPKNTDVSRIEPSAYDSATFYITFDNHERNDFTPYVFVTTDFGKTFRSLAATIPTNAPNWVRVIREDPVNRDLLFLGTDVAAYVSLDRGANWQRFMTGLPTVPVYDLKIQPRDHELIAGTHGRSIWIVDISPLEQMKDAAARGGDTHFFASNTAYQYAQSPLEGQEIGQKSFQGISTPYGAEFTYRLASGVRDSVKFTVTNAGGDTVAIVNGPRAAGAGINRAYWDFRTRAKPVPLSPSQKRDSVQYMQRIDFVVDSMEKAGSDRVALTRIRTQLTTGGGGFGGFGFGPGAASDRFVARPGEGPAPRPAGAPRTPSDTGASAAGGRGARGGAGGGAGGEAPIDQALMREVGQLVRLPGSSYPAFGRGGRSAPLAGTGDYLVTMTAGSHVERQTVRVVRMPGLDDDASIGFGGSETDDDNP
ncbi:MAG: hypothetical protein M3Z30_04585 [Gemmatimonadota bacterium]|nr:hypothetical protein [Gemmatimonadota bacterium]